MSKLVKYEATAIAIHRMSAATKTGEYPVYLAAEVEEVLKDVRDTMQNILEYWNGSPNERAMQDALEHHEREATRLLTLLAGEEHTP